MHSFYLLKTHVSFPFVPSTLLNEITVLRSLSFFHPLARGCVQSADITGYQYIKGQSFQLV